MPAVRKPTRAREVGRGEKVIPGIWRLRLPLPWPGIPHCNAWALAAGDGIVLVDTGMHEPGSMAHLERALDQAGLRIEHVRLIVITHAHVDHSGQAPTVAERAGCEVWMHPDHQHLTASLDDPDQGLARRAEVARQSGVPEAPLRAWLERRRSQGSGQAGELGAPPARGGPRGARPPRPARGPPSPAVGGPRGPPRPLAAGRGGAFKN